MTVKECATDSGKSEQTIRLWIKKRGLCANKVGFKGELNIPSLDWKNFCLTNGIERKVENGS